MATCSFSSRCDDITTLTSRMAACTTTSSLSENNIMSAINDPSSSSSTSSSPSTLSSTSINNATESSCDTSPTSQLSNNGNTIKSVPSQIKSAEQIMHDSYLQTITITTKSNHKSKHAESSSSSPPNHVDDAASSSTSITSESTSRKLYKREFRFNVGSKYRVCDVIGEGAYGVVCSAIHRPTGQKVAIKKIQPFEHQMFALRTLRELKLLRHFQEKDVSENIISILDVVKPPTYEAFNEVYLIQELMETDLHRVVRSQKLSDDHSQYFIYQILRALKVMHSADVIHRDLKPSNLLLNANCDLKVCDFGLARSVLTAEPGGENGFMTEYVATRWYRAPEIMLTFKQYTKAIDIWSVGCILAEMISERPLFPGRDYHHQISLILDVLGTPSIDDFYAIGSRRSRDYIRQMPLRKKKDFTKMFPTASPEALDFLTKTLAFNPKKRPTVEECLKHPYVACYSDEENGEPSLESLPKEYFAYDMAPRPSIEDIKAEMWREIETLPRYI